MTGLDDTTTGRKRLAAAVRDAGWLELRDDVGRAHHSRAVSKPRSWPTHSVHQWLTSRSGSGPRSRPRGGEPALRRAKAGSSRSRPICSGRPTSRVRRRRPRCTRSTVPTNRPMARSSSYPSPRVTDSRSCRSNGKRAEPDHGTDLTRIVHRVRPSVGGTGSRQGRLLTDDDLARVERARPRAHERRPRRRDARRPRHHGRVRRCAAAVRGAHRFVPVGPAPARRRALPDGRFAQCGVARIVGRRQPRTVGRARRGSRGEGILRTRGAHRVETAVQVHGGIGNTWECIVHLYLRRALLSSQWFGDDGAQLLALQRERLGVGNGLS